MGECLLSSTCRHCSEDSALLLDAGGSRIFHPSTSRTLLPCCFASVSAEPKTLKPLKTQTPRKARHTRILMYEAALGTKCVSSFSDMLGLSRFWLAAGTSLLLLLLGPLLWLALAACDPTKEPANHFSDPNACLPRCNLKSCTPHELNRLLSLGPSKAGWATLIGSRPKKSLVRPSIYVQALITSRIARRAQFWFDHNVAYVTLRRNPNPKLSDMN